MTRKVLEPGTRVGPFAIEELLGRGGMGEVYRARHTEIHTWVALKLLLPALAEQEEFVARFVREARVMRSLDHPGIVTVYEAGETDGRLYLSMRLVGSGRSLKDLLAEGRPPLARTLTTLRKLADTLDYAHSRGVVHRDVKPANVLLDDDSLPVLADFGLARAVDELSSTTLSYQFIGTPAYLSPEQAANLPVGHRADLYSFACVAFEMLAGSSPYAGQQTPTSIALAHSHDPIPRISEREPTLPAALDQVFAIALAKSPTARYPSAAMVTDAVEATFGSADSVHGAPPTKLTSGPLAPQDVTPTVPGGPARAPRRRVKIFIAAGAAIVVAVGAGVLVWDRGHGDLLAPAGSTAPTSSGTPIPAPNPVPPPAPVGSVFYTARFAEPGSSFRDDVGRPMDPHVETVQFEPDALVLTALTANAVAGTDMRVTINAGYLATMRFTVAPDSRITFDLGLRWAIPGKLAYLLRTDTSRRVVYLAIYQNGVVTPLTPPTSLPDVATGRTVDYGVRLDGDALTLWVDGRQEEATTDTRVGETAGTVPGLDVYGRPGSGSVQVTQLTYYNLP